MSKFLDWFNDPEKKPPFTIETGGKAVKIWSRQIEEGALNQALALANHPVVFKHVSLMPDVHQGYGMPIGGVIACKDAIIPNAVGVDQGCGMCAVNLNIDPSSLDKDRLQKVVGAVRKRIPVGKKRHTKPQDWSALTNHIVKSKYWFFTQMDSLRTIETAYLSLGTLGGGNHFIEFQKGVNLKDNSPETWIMIHSGSRKLGFDCANYYHKLAVEKNRKWLSNIPCEDLAFLPEHSEEGKCFLADLKLTLAFALENRKRMMNICVDEFRKVFGKNLIVNQSYDVHHNYVAKENHFGKNVWVHRKGATRARENEIDIIPGSMGTSSYIARGLGNRDSFCSCSHGAGRRLGRKEASRQLDPEQEDKKMYGIIRPRWTLNKKMSKKKGKDVYNLGESPGAYKDIEEVMLNQSELVEPLVQLKPLAVIKDTE